MNPTSAGESSPTSTTAPPGAHDDPHTSPTLVLEGHLPSGSPDCVYLPFEVPPGTREIAVRYSYDRPAASGHPGNALDIGIFDERGHAFTRAVDVPHGFRGWSGGARDSFTLSATEATPGYLPGPINPGTWHVLVAPYTVVPDGLHYRVEVTLREGPPGPAFVAKPAPTSARGRGAGWYRGDLHMHTVHSDGERQPAELVAAARDAGLDFMVSTEHNTPSAAAIWGHHAPEDLLVITGEEVTTRNGHFVVAGLPTGHWVDWRFRAVDGVLSDVLDNVHDVGALAIAAHPFAPCVGCGWKFGLAGFDAVEVWNGSWTPDDEMSLRQWDALLVANGRSGRWLPAVGSSDSHRVDEPLGVGQTVVFATDLTRDAILAGIRAGRSFVTGSSAVEVTFTATDGDQVAGMGERLACAPSTPVRVECAVRGVPRGLVRFVTDKGVLVEHVLSPDGEGTVSWTTTAAASAYVRAEVRHPPVDSMPFEPMAAFTNPIFLGAPR